MNNISLRKIDESNFLDCFQLKLAPGQEAYVSHPIRSLAQEGPPPLPSRGR